MPHEPPVHKWRLEQHHEAGERQKLRGRRVRVKDISYTDPANRNSRTYSYILGLYFRDMGKFAMLEEEDFDELDHQLLNGQRTQVQDKLVQHTLRYAISLAHRYCNRGLPFLDLIQAANCGLMVASKRYDPTRGYHFLTYADWWIRSEIFSDLDAYARQVRIPHHPYYYRVLRAMERLTNELGCEPSVEEIAVCLALPVEDIRRCWFKIKTGHDLSLQGKAGRGEDDDRSLQEITVSRTELRPDQYVEAREELEQSVFRIRHFFRWVWDTHGVKTYVILSLRYGLDGTGQKKTFAKIGEQLELTGERIRRIIEDFWREAGSAGIQKKDESWLQDRIRAITILEEVVNEQQPQFNLIQDAPASDPIRRAKQEKYQHRF